MFKVYSDGSMELTRGDTARLNVKINNDVTGEEYEMQPEDVLTLSVKKTVNDEALKFQKTVKGASTIHIEPADTQGLAFGKYKYDVQLVTAGGDVYTVIGPETLEILGEVTC